jgi:dihydrolipoamide dehydrogenase
VVGAGPGGYVAAIRLGQLGVDSVLVDAGTIGGTCLNVGCIPSKALIHAAAEFATVAAAAAKGRYGLAPDPVVADMAEITATVGAVVQRLTSGVTSLVHKAGVRVLTGRAEVVDGKSVTVATSDGPVTVRAEHLVVATGSRPAELPFLPFDGQRVISSTEALFLDELPTRLAVVGAGYIGIELGTAFAKLGSTVTIVEIAERILPLYDDALTKPVAKHVRELGVDLRLGTSAETIGASSYDKVLVTVGRAPATTGWGLESLDLAMDGRYIAVDREGRTSMRNVWAIGDVTGEPMLAHRAMAQGEVVAERIAGVTRHTVTEPIIPAVVYSDPEIVTAGLSPDEAAARGLDVLAATASFAGNGRALTLGRRDGFVRIVARRDNHAVVGLQAVGPEIGELAGVFAMALELGCVLEDVVNVVAAHPTLGEAVQESAFRALGRPLHS